MAIDWEELERRAAASDKRNYEAGVRANAMLDADDFRSGNTDAANRAALTGRTGLTDGGTEARAGMVNRALRQTVDRIAGAFQVELPRAGEGPRTILSKPSLSGRQNAISPALKAGEKYRISGAGRRETTAGGYYKLPDDFRLDSPQTAQEYERWRSTIRDRDTIQQDIDGIDSQIAQLQEQRDKVAWDDTIFLYGDPAIVSDKLDQQRSQLQAMDRQKAELERQRDLLESELEDAQYFYYTGLTQADDFGTLSRYQSTANGREPQLNYLTGIYTETGFDDINYDIINRNEAAMGHQMVNDVSTNASLLGLDNSERGQMTDEEIAIFNYLYAQDTARGDAEHSTAYAYIDYLTSDLTYRQRQAAEAEWAKYANEHPVASSVFSVLESPLKGLSYLGQAADYAADGEIDQNAGYNKFSYLNGAIRDEVNRVVEENWGGVGSFAYNTGMSMADFLFNTAVSGGNQGLALGIMGTGAAADATIDAKDRGLSDDQAFALGTIAGAAEILTEKFSLDALFDADWERGALRYILTNAFTEGSEEVGSDLINLAADVLISKDKSQWREAVRAYQAQGMSENDAFVQAALDQAAQMGLDFLGGAVSGGVMSGARSAANAVADYNAGRQLNRMDLSEGDVAAVIREGLDSAPSTQSRRQAERLQAQAAQGRQPSTYQLGRQYRANIRAVDAEEQGAQLLRQATGELVEKGAVSDGTAREILENTYAVNTLTTGAGLDLSGRMSQRQRREAVKRAVGRFSPGAEADGGIDNGGRVAYDEGGKAEEARPRAPAGRGALEESGTLAGAREADIQTARRLSNALGREIRFYDGSARRDTSGGANGYYENGTIYINSRSPNPTAQIIGHELTHSVEMADAYNELAGTVLRRIEQEGGNLEQLRQDKQALYAQHGRQLTRAEIDQELVAEFVERNLLTDEQSILNLTRQNRSLGRRILDWLNSLLAKLGNESAQERAFITRARDAYARALEQTRADSQEPGRIDLMTAGQAEEAAQARQAGATEATTSRTGESLRAGADGDLGAMRIELPTAEQAEEGTRGRQVRETAPQRQEDTGDSNAQDQELDQEARQRREEARRALLSLREDYGSGKITEAEFNAALDFVLEQESLDGESMLDRQFSISQDGGQDERQRADAQIQRYRRGEISLDELRGYLDGMADAGITLPTAEQAEGAALGRGSTEGAVEYGREDEFDAQGISGETVWGENRRSDTGGTSTAREMDAAARTGAGTEEGPAEWARGHLVDQPAAPAAKAVEDAGRYGMAAYVLDDAAIKGQSPGAWALTSGGQVYISDALPEELSGAVGFHEAIHAAKQNGALQYEELLDDAGSEIDYQSKVTEDVIGIILKSRFQGRSIFDLTDQEMETVYDELNALVWGYHKADPDNARAQFAGVFRDYDGYIRALDEAMEDAGRAREAGADGGARLSPGADGEPDAMRIDLPTAEQAEGSKRAGDSRQYSVDEAQLPGGELAQDAGQETERAYTTPDGVEVVQNPTEAVQQQMRAEAYQSYPWLWGTGEPVLRSTQDGQGNTYYWRADQDTREAQYSVDEAMQLPTAQQDEARDMIGTMPVKAQQYLKRAERYLMDKVSGLLNVPYHAKRDYLKDIVREISLEYLREGRVSEETVNSLFERAYDEGIVVEREFYDQYADLRKYLHAAQLIIAPEDSADITDFNDFRRSNFGRLNISTKGSTNIDQVYKELTERWPELFDEQREAHPADQLLRIASVAKSFRVAERSLDEYYGPKAAEYRQWARRDFEAAVADAVGELRNVRRYVDDRAAQETVEAPPTTQEEVTQMWGQLKDARRTYEKAAARNLLTEHDEVQVGRLLRGEIELESLDPVQDNVKGIREVYQAKQEYERLTRLLRQWNQSRKAALRQQADRYLQTANDWKDKRAGILYSRETMERNIRDIVNDETLAEEINRAYFTPVHDAAAAANRMKNQYRDRVRELNLSRNVDKGNLVSEAHAVQLLGEAEDNIRILEQSRGRLKVRDGKSLEDWKGIVDDLWAENPKLDADKIRSAVAQFRTIYDELFQQMNQARVRNGYEPVNYRSGYFPHFQPGNGDGILAQFGKAMGIETEVTALPTTINGLTHTFRPGIRWFGNAQERLGFNTAYDAVEGFDRYIEGVADVIHQTDNIQRLRALASQVRYRTGDEGIRKQVDEVRANPGLTEQDKQNRIEKIYETGRFALSNFVVELEEYTNLLANKKSRADRNMEQALGRNMYNLVKALESRVAANMVAVNPASWLTNFIPLTQGGALLDRGMLLKGMWDTLRAYKADDGIVDKSSFLTNRRGSDPVVRTLAQRTSATLNKPMDYIDQFVADSLVRARYRQNLGKGMSEDAAMSEADAFATGVMADRSKGAMPTLFNRSNPLTKMFTQFQLEVNNQLSYLFKDMPRDTRDKGAAALAAALLKFFLGAWLFDEVYEYVIGRRPGLDPIGILNDTVGDLTGWELPNLVELGVGAVSGNLPSFEAEKEGVGGAANTAINGIFNSLPFTSILGVLNLDEALGLDIDAGRIPLESAIPNLGTIGRAFTEEDWSMGKRVQEIVDELWRPGAYLALPFGGGQMKKIYEAIEGVIQGGSYSINAEGEQELQYPIYNDTSAQAIRNVLLAATFGRTTLPTGRDWIEGGFKTMGAKQTAVYQGLLEAGVPGEEAYALLERLRGAEKSGTESEAAQERRLLEEANISGEGKSIVYYGLMATDRERELMDDLADGDADMGEVTAALMGIKDAGALKGAAASNAKRDAIAGAALSEEEQIQLYNYTFGEKQDDGSYVSSRAGDIAAFQDAGLSFEQFLDAQNEYSTINEDYDRPGEKAVEFARWVNNQGFTGEQAAVVKDAFTYYSQVPQSGGYYEKFVAAGMSDESAYGLNEALDSLEPQPGEEQVTSLQRYQAVVDAGLIESEQMAALEELMPENEYEKLRAGNQQGVTPRAYVSFKQSLPLYDADGNGSFKQEEVREALDSLPLTTEQKAALWQMQNKSWKPQNNPYSVSVSRQVYDTLNADDGDDSGLMDWSSGITLPRADETDNDGLMNWN